MSRSGSIRVAGVNAAASLVRTVATSFNHAVADCAFDAAGAIEFRLRAGQAADVAILPLARIETLERDGFLVPGGSRDIGRTRAGVAVRQSDAADAPRDDDGLRGILLAAPAIFIPDPSSSTAGRHMAAVFGKMRVLESIGRSLVVCVNGAEAMRRLAASPFAGAIGFTQSTEIMSVAGVRLLAPLPDLYALTTVYSAGVVTASASKKPARLYIESLCGPRSARSRSEAGFF